MSCSLADVEGVWLRFVVDLSLVFVSALNSLRSCLWPEEDMKTYSRRITEEEIETHSRRIKRASLPPLWHIHQDTVEKTDQFQTLGAPVPSAWSSSSLPGVFTSLEPSAQGLSSPMGLSSLSVQGRWIPPSLWFSSRFLLFPNRFLEFFLTTREDLRTGDSHGQRMSFNMSLTVKPIEATAVVILHTTKLT